MTAGELISLELFPLKKGDTAEAAVLLMEDWKVHSLPVVEGGAVLGYCLLKDLVELPGNEKIGTHLMKQPTPVLQVGQHLFEVLRVFSELNLSAAAVVEQDVFKGIISGRDLLGAYKQSALSQPGGIIEMQMPARSYSLSEISRLIESNDAKILHLFVKSLNDESGHIEVSLKLNTSDLKNVLNTLERFQYNITGVYQAAEIVDNFQSRYINLIKFLNT